MLPNKLATSYPSGFQLREDHQLVFQENRAAFYGKSSFQLEPITKTDQDFLKRLRNGLTGASAQRAVSHSRYGKLLEQLHQLKVLRPFVPLEKKDQRVSRQLEWLSHFCADAGGVQEAFEKRRVTIVGCGGTGAIVAEHLVRAGIGGVVLIDPAVIDRPDLNRQLTYFPEDVGKLKVEVLARLLTRTNDLLSVVSIPKAISCTQDLEEVLGEHPCDLIINCADKPMGLIQKWVTEAATLRKVPVLFGGVGLEDGSVGPLLVEQKEKVFFARAMEKAYVKLGSQNAPLKSSLCFSNSLIAVGIAFEAFKFLNGMRVTQILNRSYVLKFMDNTIIHDGVWA